MFTFLKHGKQANTVRHLKSREQITRRRLGVEQLDDRRMLSLTNIMVFTGMEGGAPVEPPARIEIQAFSIGATNPSGGADAAVTLLNFVQDPRHDEPLGYMSYTMKDALVTSYQHSGMDHQVPTEQFSLNFATIHIPRIGQEVVVDFLEGDPDQPIVIRSIGAGRDPGLGANLPPGGLSELLTNSFGNSEQIHIHAEKNQDIEVENDETHWVSLDRRITVDHDSTIVVSHDRTQVTRYDERLSVATNRTETVDNNETITVHGMVGINESITVGAAQEITVGSAQSIVAGAAQVLEAGESMVLMTGQLSLTLSHEGDLTLARSTQSPLSTETLSGFPSISAAYILPYIELDSLYRPIGGPDFHPAVSFMTDPIGPHANISWAQLAVNIVDYIDNDEFMTQVRSTEPLEEDCDDGPTAALAIELENTLITSYSYGGHAGFPQESLSINYSILPAPAPENLATKLMEQEGLLYVNVQPGSDGPHFCVQYRETAFNFVSSLVAPVIGLDPHDFHTLITVLDNRSANQAPVVSLGEDAIVLERQTFHRSGSFADGDGGVWTATVDYGDGSGERPLELHADKTFDLNHTYRHDGTFTATVRIMDEQGEVGSDTLLVRAQNVDLIVVGSDAGYFPIVRVFDANSHLSRFTITPYESRFRGGVRVATGDVNDDGIPDIITAPGASRQPLIRVFDGRDGQPLGGPLGSFLAFEPNFKAGVHVAVGDVNGDGFQDVIVARGKGAPEVRVFSGQDGAKVLDFLAFSPTFNGGVTVAAGDVNGDGRAEIVVGAGPSRGGPVVKTFDGLTGSQLSSFLAYPANFRGGVNVAVGDLNSDGFDDIITGAGRGGAPHVKAFDGSTLQAIDSFFAYEANFQGGVRVGAGDFDGDGQLDIVTGPGPSTSVAQKVRLFDGLSLELLDSFFAVDAKAKHGWFVAASR